ncbi:MAG: arylamine N-acetyltransferase [Chloroflexi bacterium]|nr:arylamine N-acetyltransferase [Chloroflexota bacterium]
MTATHSILRFLKIKQQPPSPAFLDALVTAYTRHVPWESAFRIAKRAATPVTAECPRWPVEFWADALERGGGGTCFESNYAFFRLLRELGFDGYLTVNDMGESRGCHTAIVVCLGDQRWLVDAGYPLYLPVPLAAGQTTHRQTPFHTYTVTPQPDYRFEIQRDRHPKPYTFTLIDRPVPDDDYRAATTADYAPDGHFLTEVIVHKVIDDRVWRLNGRVDPPLLESFPALGDPQPATCEPLPTPDAPARLARLFGMEQGVLQRAFDWLAEVKQTVRVVGLCYHRE